LLIISTFHAEICSIASVIYEEKTKKEQEKRYIVLRNHKGRLAVYEGDDLMMAE